MAEIQSLAVPVSAITENVEVPVKAVVAGASERRLVDDVGSPSVDVEVSHNHMKVDVRNEETDAGPQLSSSTPVMAGSSIASQPVCVSAASAMLLNRRLVLKQLSNGQFALTVQPMPADVIGGPFMMTSAQTAEASPTCCVTVDNSYDPVVPEAHTMLQVAEVGIDNVEMPDVCVDGSSVCLVCGDKGSGFHYSVFSCEGCKGFFKRTVQRNMVYSCKESGVCNVSKVTRNNCQYCRFRRCLEAGMKKEAVRDDRTPGGKHRAKKPRLDETDMSSGHVMIDWNGSELDEQLLSQLVDTKPDVINTADDMHGITSSSGQGSVKEFMPLIYLELRCIIEWAKKVPGFLELVSEDQMALLKSSFMELTVLRLSYRSLDCVLSVRFCNSLVMSVSQCRNLGCGEDFVMCTLEFISRLRPIAIDNAEFCILCAVVLTYPDAGGLVDRTSVLTLHNTWLDLLQKYSISRYPDDPRRSSRILLRLMSLRSVSAKAADKFLSCAVDVDVKMTDIVQEMIS